MPSRRGSAPPLQPLRVRWMPCTPLVISIKRTSWPSARSGSAQLAAAVPCSSSVGPLRLPKLGSAIACWISRFQSSAATKVLTTWLMMALPPAEPRASTSLPSRSNTMVGAMALRGRLPGSMRLATGFPSCSATKEKSVSWLFRRKPRTICWLPKAYSIEVVIATALPSASTMDRWLVEASSSEASSASSASGAPGGEPGRARPSDRFGWTRAARAARYPGDISPASGTATKSLSAR